MKGYACYSDGHWEKFNTENEKLDTNHLKFILLRLRSFLFGTAYTYVEKSEWKKIKDIHDIKFKYDFLDGVLSDEREEDEITVHNRYHYDNMAQLYAKLTEIVISEDVLNDSFWIHDSYYQYLFDNLKIQYSNKGYKYKYNDCSKMYEALGSNYSTDGLYEYITLGKNKYKTTRSHRKLKNQKTFVYYGNGIYFEVNKDFYDDVKSAVFDAIISVYDYDDAEYSELYAGNFMRYEYNRKKDSEAFRSGERKNKVVAGFGPSSSVHDLLQCKFAQAVIAKLESSNDVYYFRLFTELHKLNGEKTHKDFNKFIHKYFPSLPEDEEDYSLPISVKEKNNKSKEN